MSDKRYSVEFLFHPMLSVVYLVDHPNGVTDQSLSIELEEDCPSRLVLSLPIGSQDDVVRYSYHVMASFKQNALAIGSLLLANDVIEDYHSDAYADIVSASAVVDDD